MSLEGGYVPTGMANGADDHDREQKRRKTSPSGTFKQPQPPNSKPQAPEERTDINNISDLVHTSGIDLKSEEDYLANSYQNRQAPRHRYTQPADQHQTSTQPKAQPGDFDLLSRTNFPSIGQQNNAAQQPQIKPEPADELEDRQKLAARARAEAEQHQLNDPFLQGYSMRQRMERIANDHGIKLPMSGLYDKINRRTGQADRPAQASSSQAANASRTGLTINTQNTPSSQIDDDAPSMLNRGAPLDPVFSLLSLATADRIRGLFEDAFALTRGRQISSDGRIPPEYRDLVLSADLDPATSQQPTQNGTTDPSSSFDPTAQPAAQALPPTISAILAAEAATDRLAEEARIRKRAARKAKRAAALDAANKDPNATTSGAGTPSSTANADGTPTGGGALGNIAPEALASLPKISKKEMERQKKADMANEAAATRNANSAVAMALGGKAKYSWMSKGGAGGSGANTPMRGSGGAKGGGGIGAGGGGSGAGTPGGNAGKSNGVSGGENGALSAKVGKDGLPPKGLDRTYGVWREDGPGGKDVQLRDWIGALEGDGRERKALALALLRLGREALLDG